MSTRNTPAVRHYGFFDVGGRHLRAALRQAQTLMDFADDVLRR